MSISFNMNPLIKAVIEEWVTAKSPYSFETRISPILNPSQITVETPFVNLVFIIDVQGFFIDKEHTKPIKLHHERLITIDRYNTDSQYIDDLRNDLELLTAEAHAQFEKTLSSFTQPVYTSDPNFMK